MPQFGRSKAALASACNFAAAGDWVPARHLCEELLDRRGFKSEAMHLMGCIASGEGNLSDAVTYLRRATRLSPCRATWVRDLGIALVAAERPVDAATAFARCLTIDPGNRPALSPYAFALWQSGKLKAALKVYLRLTRTDPVSTEGWFGAARCLFGLDRLREAEEHARHGLQLDPDSSAGHELLADIYHRFREHEKQLSHCLELVRLNPDDPVAQGYCASAHYHFGETELSIALFRRALAAGDNPNLHAIYLSVLLHSAESSSQSLTEEHRVWGCRYAPAVTEYPFSNTRDSQRKLMLGYLVSEGANSPVMYFLKPILRHHNRADFDVKLYYTDASMKDCGQWLAISPSEAHAAVDLAPLALTEKIRNDGVDIFIDVCGHYGGNLLAAANRAAPLQVSYPSYPATTGVPQMDYIFTDRWTCDPKQESQYTESAIVLDSGYLAYDPPHRPRIGALPAESNHFVTFGVFQRPAKLNSGVWDAIAEVLHRVPNSRILFHHASADLHRPGSASREWLVSSLESRSIPGARCAFAGSLSISRHLATIATVDIALDSFPYNGQTTTCECLWMGVPVVTLEGQTHVSRVSSGILSRVGLAAYVAASPEEYVATAVRTTHDLTTLAELRKGLRERFRASTVFGGERLVREMESAYRQIWRKWLDSQSSKGNWRPK